MYKGFNKPCQLGEVSMQAKTYICFCLFAFAGRDAKPFLEENIYILTIRDVYAHQRRCALVSQTLFFTVYGIAITLIFNVFSKLFNLLVNFYSIIS